MSRPREREPAPGDTVQVMYGECVRDLPNSLVMKVGFKEIVLPKSQFRESTPEEGDVGSFCLPRWLAEDRELQYEEL